VEVIITLVGTSGLGAPGGGGNGGQGQNTSGQPGTVNLGGGGGGGSDFTPGGGSGGKGVIILSIPTAKYSGTTTGSPTVTTSGTNTILKYTGTGSYTA
jgi:mucin-19